jgi:hypothetical protein
VKIDIQLLKDSDGNAVKHCPFIPPVQLGMQGRLNGGGLDALQIFPVPCLKDGCALYDADGKSCGAKQARCGIF